ncbi:MAG TPA: radical SAM protein [Terriglobia bacterium]|nr:radical SAM protein [Terriglobia bacterium]
MSSPLVQIAPNAPSERLLRLKRQFVHLPRAPRYLLPVLQHGTPVKWANIALVETELLLRRTKLKSFPFYYFVDPCNVCNLRCPLCPTGNYTLDRNQGMMSFATFKSIIDQIKRYALTVGVYNLGEPFLNRQIFDMIEYAQANNIGTNLSSNFNWPVPVDVRDIVRSGLEYITVSLDGLTQETYSRYRVNGDVKEVFENMKALLAAREAMHSKTPVVEWQFIVFEHNEHELPQVKQLAKQLGVDRLRLVPPTIPPELVGDQTVAAQWLPHDPVYRENDPRLAEQRGYIHDEACFYLYRTMRVDPDGSVAPCCYARSKTHTFGNLLEHSLEQIWNNESYQSARMLFGRKSLPQDRTPVFCDLCPMYKRSALPNNGLSCR